MQNASPVRSPTNELMLHHVRFVGGTTAVTKFADTGQGITPTYISTGIVDLIWAENPGNFQGLAGMPDFQATTASAVKGFTCVPGVYNATTFTLRLNITNASETLVDLAALQWLSVCALFKRSGAGV